MATDRAKIWLKMDRRRRGMEPVAFRIIVRAMVRAVQPFRDAIPTYTSAADLAELGPDKISREEIERGYIAMYQRVMPDFANSEYDQVSKSLKADATLREQWAGRVQTYVTHELAPRITRVTETLETQVRNIVLKGMEQGLTITELSDQIDTLGLDEIISNRSRVIARTETINASNRGSMMGAEATGLALKKEWIATIDGRERPGHAEAAAQYQRDPIPIKDPFFVNGEELQYPGDPSGSPGNVIQCRCTQAFIPE